MDGMAKNNNDENQALVAHTRRGERGSPSRRRASPKREASPESRRKKDLSKIRCFKCHDFHHYATQCPLRRRGKRQHASITEIDDIANRFQKEILLVSGLSGAISGRETWLVDNEASFHMTGG
jgi:hypothetical protein